MGRGIVEYELFRAERYGWDVRTSDPQNHSEGEAWIRSDLSPDTDQIGTLRWDAGGGTIWDIPIFGLSLIAHLLFGSAQEELQKDKRRREL